MVTVEEIIAWSKVHYDWLIIFGIIILFTIISIRYFRNKQERDPEPIILLLFAVILGVISVIPSLVLSVLMLLFIPEAYGAIVIAPIAEEIGKAMILGMIAWTRIVDGPMDGFVYGAMVGTGFAAAENLLYAYSAFGEGGLFAGLFVASFRSAFQIIGHPLYTGITGYGVGMYKAGKANRKYYTMWFAMVMHALWNATSVIYTQYWFYTFPGVIIFSIIILKILVSRARSKQ